MNEIIPFPSKVNGESRLLVGSQEDKVTYLLENPRVEASDVCLTAIALFREQDYVDYMAVAVPDEEGGESWTIGFEMYEMTDWMAGFVYDNERREAELRHTHRELGKFILKYGWAPDVVLETRPSPQEFDNYVAWVSRELDGEIDIEGLADD